jgi:hypothetical protein
MNGFARAHESRPLECSFDARVNQNLNYARQLTFTRPGFFEVGFQLLVVAALEDGAHAGRDGVVDALLGTLEAVVHRWRCSGHGYGMRGRGLDRRLGWWVWWVVVRGVMGWFARKLECIQSVIIKPRITLVGAGMGTLVGAGTGTWVGAGIGTRVG